MVNNQNNEYSGRTSVIRSDGAVAALSGAAEPNKVGEDVGGW